MNQDKGEKMAQSRKVEPRQTQAVQLPSGDLWRPRYGGREGEGNIDLTASDDQGGDKGRKLRQLVKDCKQENGTYTCPFDGTSHENSKDFRDYIEKHFPSRVAGDDHQERDALRAMARRTVEPAAAKE